MKFMTNKERELAICKGVHAHPIRTKRARNGSPDQYLFDKRRLMSLYNLLKSKGLGLSKRETVAVLSIKAGYSAYAVALALHNDKKFKFTREELEEFYESGPFVQKRRQAKRA